MATRLAACDPCRFSKLSCDHARPVCGRCLEKNQSVSCIYRARPFKKRRTQSLSRSTPERRRAPRDGSDALNFSESTPLQAKTEVRSQHYPNPGFLGSSSHASIFEHLVPTTDAGHDDFTTSQHKELGGGLHVPVDEALISRTEALLCETAKSTFISSCSNLVEAWFAKDFNLVVAAPFTKLCAQATRRIFEELAMPSANTRQMSTTLLLNSSCPLAPGNWSSLDDFAKSFCEATVRIETIGLFFAAVARATIDLTELGKLCVGRQQKLSLRKFAVSISDACLDLALSLDCLNDVQLMLQYENFILHSFADGDQSYHSWKKLGDVLSSIFALGYHEKIAPVDSCPAFLRHWRQATVSRIYSADKNVSIFLGRPPRIHRRHCNFDFLDTSTHDANNLDGEYISKPRYFGFEFSDRFDYKVDTWWSLSCCLLKEETLDLSWEKHHESKIQKALDIRVRAEQLWQKLPSKYRKSGNLKSADYEPIERDFIVGARLNYLHVFFLLHLSCTQRFADMPTPLLTVSAEMLDLVVETGLLKDKLINSGTGLIWKIAYYGLPAAGILCLYLLNTSLINRSLDVSMPKVFQNLCVLVAQVETGSLIESDDPNYGLLVEAAKTIKVILNRVLLGKPAANVLNQTTEDDPPLITIVNEQDWAPWTNQDILDFEVDFWTSLAEHPGLIADNNVVPD